MAFYPGIGMLRNVPVPENISFSAPVTAPAELNLKEPEWNLTEGIPACAFLHPFAWPGRP